MPANPGLKARILNSQLFRSGNEFTSAGLAGHLKEKTKAVAACLSNLSDEKKVVKLEQQCGGMALYQRRVAKIANIPWDKESLCGFFGEESGAEMGSD